MARISIELPDELRAKAQALADEYAHGSIERYIEALLRADAAAHDFGAPPHLTFSTSAELESMLAAAERSGAPHEIADTQWEVKRQRLIDRSRPSSANP